MDTADLRLGVQNLLRPIGSRTLLTMLGMIFGVAAVVSHVIDRGWRTPESNGGDRADGRSQL